MALFNDASDEEDILRRADTAMYDAKGGGRNRITVDSGSPGQALDRSAESHADRRAHHAG
jgi:predicted signal transduction protein with EAL and GGDEF domain